jgi:NAD+ synthetase
MKILMAQKNYILGDIPGNTAKILAEIQRHGNEVDLIVFSELCFTGYYPKDYLQRVGFIDVQDEHLAAVRRATRGIRASVVVGFADRNPFLGKPLFNALGLLENGELTFVYHKQLLCDYNIFNELRHFETGTRPGVAMVKGKRLGFLICEDAWNDGETLQYGVDPVARLEREKLDLVVSINGSPSNIGKQQQRMEVIGRVARRCGAPVVYVNQVGGYDDIVYDGASLVVDRTGLTQYMLPGFEEASEIVELMGHGNICQDVAGGMHPYPAPLDDRELFYRQAVLGIRDYLGKTGFGQAVIGLSGGIDSAVVTMMAVMAVGRENVTALLMPSRFSSRGSIDDSLELCRNFGIASHINPIEEEFSLGVANFARVYGKEPGRLTMENMQARIRGRKLMEFSNDNGALVLSTGNKSETSVGYCTLYGDMVGAFNPLGDLYKTDVREIARYHNERYPELAIPAAILTKAPSAELFEGQKDSDSLPEYGVLDAILKLYVEQNSIGEREKRECLATLALTPTSVIGRVLRLVDSAEYKRQQGATILRMRQVAFGDGRQFPITGKYFDEQFCQQLLGRCSGGAC